MLIDVNADLGEGCDNDEAMLDLVTSVNIACGWHAGSDAIMERTVRAALRRGVAIGAHPSYPGGDFGRSDVERTPDEIRADVTAQIEALETIARRCGAHLRHVKPHGALYNRAASDRRVADAVVGAIAAHDARLGVVGLAGSELVASARAHGLRAIEEVFADRGYAADGTLIPRGQPGALVHDVDAAVAAALSFVRRGIGQTICVHGDGPNAVTIARAIRDAFTENGVDVACVA